MRTRAGEAAKRVADHAKALVGLELELATLELKRKAGALGLGAALLAGAAVFGLLALGFGLAAVAAVLALVVPTWAALLITFGIAAVLAAVLGATGLSLLRQGAPPVPEQAIREARLTTEALRSNGSR